VKAAKAVETKEFIMSISIPSFVADVKAAKAVET
jgi:hypothetical protein